MKKKLFLSLTMLSFLTLGSLQLFAGAQYGLHRCCPATSSQGGWAFGWGSTGSSSWVNCYYILPDGRRLAESYSCF